MVHQQNTYSSMELDLSLFSLMCQLAQLPSVLTVHVNTHSESLGSQVQQYTVSVAARNVVGVETASTSVTVGM